MRCPVTGYKCLKKDCRQFNPRRTTCQLEHLREYAFKFMDLATLLQRVIEITDV